jgi:hypothetical protein
MSASSLTATHGARLAIPILNKSRNGFHSPFIGVPWHKLEYGAEMVAVGHETGHAVERDLELEPLLDKTILRALAQDTSRVRYWKAWRSELSPMPTGCAATGPAFASALGDFLANVPGYLNRRLHPRRAIIRPRLLRWTFNREIITTMGLDAEIPRWNLKDPGWRPAPFQPEAAAIAQAFAGARGPLGEMLTFTPGQWNAARKRASDAAAWKKPRHAGNNLRVLIAVIRFSFESSPEHWDRPANERPSPLARIRVDIAPLIRAETRAHGMGIFRKTQGGMFVFAAMLFCLGLMRSSPPRALDPRWKIKDLVHTSCSSPDLPFSSLTSATPGVSPLAAPPRVVSATTGRIHIAFK